MNKIYHVSLLEIVLGAACSSEMKQQIAKVPKSDDINFRPQVCTTRCLMKA